MSTNAEMPGRPQALLDVSATETLAAWMTECPNALIGAVTPTGAPTEIPSVISARLAASDG